MGIKPINYKLTFILARSSSYAVAKIASVSNDLFVLADTKFY